LQLGARDGAISTQLSAGAHGARTVRPLPAGLAPARTVRAHAVPAAAGRATARLACHPGVRPAAEARASLAQSAPRAVVQVGRAAHARARGTLPPVVTRARAGLGAHAVVRAAMRAARLGAAGTFPPLKTCARRRLIGAQGEHRGRRLHASAVAAAIVGAAPSLTVGPGEARHAAAAATDAGASPRAVTRAHLLGTVGAGKARITLARGDGAARVAHAVPQAHGGAPLLGTRAPRPSRLARALARIGVAGAVWAAGGGAQSTEAVVDSARCERAEAVMTLAHAVRHAQPVGLAAAIVRARLRGAVETGEGCLAPESKQRGSGLGQLALGKLLSATEHVSGCPKLRPVSRLGRAGRPYQGSVSTWPPACTSR
jgi:hypothetical protein